MLGKGQTVARGVFMWIIVALVGGAVVGIMAVVIQVIR